MSVNPDEGKDELVKKAKAIGTILGVPLVFFAIINNFISQPIVALIVALVTAVIASWFVVHSGWIGITNAVIGWLLLIIVGLAAFVIWPRTMLVEGIISNTAGNPLINETVVLIDANGVTRQTNTDAQGHYQFKNVPTGPYKVRIREFEGGGGAGGFLVRRVETNLKVPEAVVVTTPTPTPTVTTELISTPTPTLTAIPTPDTPTPTPTPTSTFTPMPPTETFTPMNTPTPTPTPASTPNAEFYFNRGVAHFNKGEYDQAIADYTEAIQLDPDYEEAYFDRGNAYFQIEDFDLAIADYTKIIEELNPERPWAYGNRGLAYEGKNEFDLARADYEKMIELDDNQWAKEQLEAIRTRSTPTQTPAVNLNFTYCGSTYNCTPNECRSLCESQGMRMATYSEVNAWVIREKEDYCVALWMLNTETNKPVAAFPMYTNQTTIDCGPANTGDEPRMVTYDGDVSWDYAVHKYDCACAVD